jgi:hypothetical protein
LIPEKLEQDFPYWKRLHGFWRTLPNFNPYTVSSEPGQDLAAEALTLIQCRGESGDDENDSSSDDHPAPDVDINNQVNLNGGGKVSNLSIFYATC